MREFQLAKCSFVDAVDDFISAGSNYFVCGYVQGRNSCYYNLNFIIFLELLGNQIRKKIKCKSSDFHVGVAAMAKVLSISKRQVKILRKNVKYHGGYVFKIPRKSDKILLEIIEKIEKNPELFKEDFLKENDRLYRTVFLGEQYTALSIVANNSTIHNSKISNLYSELSKITKKIFF